MLTDDELKAMKERLERATPGPWVKKDLEEGQWVLRSQSAPNFGIPVLDEYLKHHQPYIAYGINHRDANLIAHSRTDMEKLINEVERLKAEIDGICRHHNVEMVSGRKRDYLYCNDCQSDLDGGERR
jgi:hypothetical protein